MTSDDLMRVLTWRNDPRIRRYMLTQHEISFEEHRQWFERASQDSSRRLLVFEAAGKPCGYVGFHGVVADDAADWGFYAAPDAPKGTGRRLGRAALDFAFDVLGLHKVCGQVLALNEPSIEFHRALGFRQEGVLREQHRLGDAYHDLVCFGLLEREWYAMTRRAPS